MSFDPCKPLALVVTDEGRVPVVEAGVALWRDVFPVQVTVIQTPTTAPSLPIHFVESALYMGRFDDGRGTIELATRVPEGHPMAVVLAHELGHAYNLYHVSKGERVSVMNKGNHEVGPTAEDGAALTARWGRCPR